jgi:CO/xanthine dehydrogenase FAD-binding subunit
VITAYYRPDKKIDAINLYNRSSLSSIFVLGSSKFGNDSQADFEVIDLQNIPFELSESEASGGVLDGFDFCETIAQKSDLPSVLKMAIRHDLTANQRNSTPIAGYLFHANGQSMTASVLLAMDASVTIFSNDQKMKFGDWILLRDKNEFKVWQELDLSTSAEVNFEFISKTPGDMPELVVALAKWKSGRTRLVIGSVEADFPQMVFDGTEKSGIVDVAKNACSHLFKNQNKSEYLSEMTTTLLDRLLSSQ